MENNENMVCNTSQDVDVKCEMADQSSDVCDKKERLACNKCNLSSCSFEDLENHFHCFHVAEKRLKCFNCTSCRKEYVSLDTLMNHLRREHTLETVHACDNCGEKLPICFTLPTHYRLIKYKKTLCNTCKELLGSKKKQKQDKNENFEFFPETKKKANVRKVGDDFSENRIVLAECNANSNGFFQESSTSLAAVFHHRDLAHSSQRTAIDSKKDLQSVCGVIDSKKDPFMCKICQLSFSLFDVLEDHLRSTHIVESIRKKLFCRICSKEFNVIEDLMNHFREDHTSQINPQHCNDGIKVSYPHRTTTEVLTQRIEPHCSPCLTQQEMCGKNFASESVLTAHTVNCKQSNDNYTCDISSKGENHSSCDNCYQTFPYRRFLASHRCKSSCKKDSSSNVSEYESKLGDDRLQQIDGGPFSCKKCSKQFLNKEKLVDHSRIHILQYRCEICEKAFSKNCHLREHRLVHTGEKPYSCDICGQKYSARRHLNRHYRKHSDKKDICDTSPQGNPDDVLCEHRPQNTEESYACGKCGKHFLNKEKLDEHSLTHSPKHRCDICEKIFNRRRDLRDHRVVHKGEKPYSCDICGQKYRFRSSLSNHRCKISSAKNESSKQVEQEPSYCEKCDKQFPNKNKLMAHSKIHILKHSCEICGKAFSKMCNLRDHRLVHTGEKPFSCDICDQKFSRMRYLTKHYRNHSGVKDLCDKCPKENPNAVPCEHRPQTTEEPCACDECGKQFTSKGKLSDHSRTHVLKHRCEICGKAFCRRSRLRDHGIVHTGERPYSCDFCSAKFVCKASLKKHAMLHESTPANSVVQPLLYPCDICNKVLSSKYSLRTHRLGHTPGEKPHACHICDKKFATAKFLTKHYLRHAGERYFCEICGKGFSSEFYLRNIHNRTHTGEKPFACIVCESRFPSMQQMKLHFRIHSGERPFECETCGKKFAFSEDLKKHVRVHTGEKPYVCDVCQRGFTQKWVLVAHRRIHTGERPFECEVCQRGFIYKSQMKTHQLTHFKSKPTN